MVYSITKPYYISSCSLCFTIAITFKSLYIYISLFTNPSYNKNMYFTSWFLVIKPLALYSVKYSLNYLSTCPAKNNPM
jgi:hypothetical protein